MNAEGTSDLEQIERKAYQTIWDDGLIDIFVGLALFLIGVFWVSQGSAYSTFVAPVLVPFWVVARKRFSEPRTGVVHFSRERLAKENKKLRLLFLFGVFTFMIGVFWFFFGSHGESLSTPRDLNIVAGLPAALLAVPAIIVALAYGLGRFLAYAVMLLVSALPVIYLDLHPGWAFIPGGLLGIGVGSTLLFRFVRKHPLGG